MTARLWHGGPPGHKPGDLILATGAHRGDTGGVYVTEDRDYARQYAANVPLGDLYRVEPVDEFPIERAAGHSLPTYTAGAVRVVSVYDRAIRLTRSQRRALLRRWGDARVDE